MLLNFISQVTEWLISMLSLAIAAGAVALYLMVKMVKCTCFECCVFACRSAARQGGFGLEHKDEDCAGKARGLEYLCDKASPPVIYQRYKPSNILVDEGFHPKLSDFGLVTLGSVGDNSHVSTHVMGTYGYCAPQCATTGQLTLSQLCAVLGLSRWS
jgi:hypothetical protein